MRRLERARPPTAFDFVRAGGDTERMSRWLERARDRRAERALERQRAYQEAKAIALPDRERHAAWRAFWATEVKRRIERVRPVPPGARVLEVGSGAHGLVFFLGYERAVGVDPLADVYAELFPEWQRLARTVKAFGEALPFEDGAFDLVLSDNCVDHARDPRAIVREMARVLRPGGVLYFNVHVHHPLYAAASAAHAAWSALGVPFEVGAFADHTAHFTLPQARALFEGLPLRILRESHDAEQARADARVRPLRHPMDALKRVFFKNALFEVIAERA